MDEGKVASDAMVVSTELISGCSVAPTVLPTPSRSVLIWPKSAVKLYSVPLSSTKAVLNNPCGAACETWIAISPVRWRIGMLEAVLLSPGDTYCNDADGNSECEDEFHFGLERLER